MQDYLQEWQEPQQNSEAWPLVTAEALKHAATRQRRKAAGVDGWSGAEVAALPLDFWSECLPIFHFFEATGTGCCPSGWQEIRQTHLPKSNVSHLAVPTSKMRPVSIFRFGGVFLSMPSCHPIPHSSGIISSCSLSSMVAGKERRLSRRSFH